MFSAEVSPRASGDAELPKVESTFSACMRLRPACISHKALRMSQEL